eukprot:gb/GECG01014282.1/.p1 GENE.gb/GECG01014282.1/~~gb/GECG01014282.1/.p1  ORF type:complete len:446 (+),score=23.39 gb/GECG01014282.1/:1-1338(+)
MGRWLWLWLWLLLLCSTAAAVAVDTEVVLHGHRSSEPCNHHGEVGDNGECTCDKFWSGKHCGTNYIHVIGSAAWGGLVYTTCTIQGLIVLMTVYQFICRHMCYLTPQRPRFTFRDTSALLNALGSVSRITWFINMVVQNEIVVGFIVEELFLRLPQIFWIASYLCLVLVWTDIMAAAKNQHVSTRMTCSVVVSMIILSAIVVPLSLAVGIEKDNHLEFILSNVANTVVAGYVVILEFAGLIFLYRSWKVIQKVRDQSTDTYAARLLPVYKMAVQTTLALLLSVILGVVLFVSVIVLFATQVSPVKDPKEYLAFLYIVHVGVECGAAATICFATWPARDKGRRTLREFFKRPKLKGRPAGEAENLLDQSPDEMSAPINTHERQASKPKSIFRRAFSSSNKDDETSADAYGSYQPLTNIGSADSGTDEEALLAMEKNNNLDGYGSGG